MVVKAIKVALKWLVFLIGASIFLVAVYILLNTHFGRKYRRVTEADLKRYTDYLETHISEPPAFISQKFETCDVVLLGEIHGRKQDLELVKSLIPYLYKRNGISVIGWEFGSSDFQAEVDSLVNAPEYDESKAIRIMRTFEVDWNYKEYLDIFRIIWRLNRDLPPGRPRVRFLQLGWDLNDSKLYSPDPVVRSEERKRRRERDRHMADIVDREVLQRGKKILWYSGLHHAFTRYRQPRFFFQRRTGEKRRAGNFLYDRYPGRVYCVALHAPVLSPLSVLEESFPSLISTKTYYPFGGVIDKVYAQKKRPFAFDTAGSPFGELKDNYSYYSVDRWGGLKLRDFCDGYVVLCSFEEAEPVDTIPGWIPSEDVFNEIKASRLSPSMAARFKSLSDFLTFLEERRSKIIRSTHDIEK
jgi:hypothetical protein